MSHSPHLPNKQFRNIHVFDILRYRLPMPGIISILHRISGLLMFLLIPALLLCWEASISHPYFFDLFAVFFSYPLVKVGVWVSFWALAHHLLAGLRFLSLDLHWGVTKEVASRTSKVVFWLGVIVTILFAVWTSL